MTPQTFDIRFPDNVWDVEPEFFDNAFRMIQSKGRIVRISCTKLYSSWVRKSPYHSIMETSIDPPISVDQGDGINMMVVEIA